MRTEPIAAISRKMAAKRKGRTINDATTAPSETSPTEWK